jgi:uncharacterized protein YndB with AHSA1/START domain
VSSNTRIMSATPEQVWDVLSDGWLYPLWVVGASRMREVDDAWPQPGARLHHSVGAWPLLLNDKTEVLESVPGARLKLRAHGWPAGAAEVTLHLVAHAEGTEVTLEEIAAEGPGALVPQPLQDPVLAWRNSETLRRLAYLVERRQQRI